VGDGAGMTEGVDPLAGAHKHRSGGYEAVRDPKARQSSGPSEEISTAGQRW
jgi:hypothetical protein